MNTENAVPENRQWRVNDKITNDEFILNPNNEITILS